jgi:hypothetical protein
MSRTARTEPTDDVQRARVSRIQNLRRSNAAGPQPLKTRRVRGGRQGVRVALAKGVLV